MPAPGDVFRIGGDLPINRLGLYRVDPLVPMADQLGALTELQDQGKIRHLGLSKVNVATLDAAREPADIATVQNPFNYRDRSSQDVLDRCTDLGICFIAYRPFQKGLLSRPTSAQAGATPGQRTLAWLLNRAPVLIAIPGTSRSDHLEENVRAGVRTTHQEQKPCTA